MYKKNFLFLLVSLVIGGLYTFTPSTQAADELSLWRLSKYQAPVGTSITVTGTGFTSSTQVHLGGTTITPSIQSSKQLVFVVPNVTQDKTYNFYLSRSNNTSSTQQVYVPNSSKGVEFWRLNTYVASLGQTITATGKNITSSIKVYLGSRTISPSSTSANSLTFVVPNDLTTDKTYAVAIGDANGKSANQNLYVKTSASSSIELWRLSNYAVSLGDKVTVTGKGITANTKVYLGSRTISPSSTSANSLTFVVPNDLTTDKTYAVAIGDANGKSANQNLYVKTSASSSIELWRLSNYAVSLGDKVTVTGKGITANTKVYLGSRTISPSSTSANSLTFVVPNNLTTDKTYAVAIGDANGKSANQNLYVKTSASSSIELWTLSKYSAFAGESITVTGKNLNATGIAVYLDDTKITPSNTSSSQLTFTIPKDIKVGQTYTLTLKAGTKKSSTQNLYIKDPKWEK